MKFSKLLLTLHNQFNNPMGSKPKFSNSKTVTVEVSAYNEVIEHILTYYGNIGKFFSMAAKEKKINDLKKLANADTGND